MFDLCLVLQSISTPQYSALYISVENYTHSQRTTGPLMVSNEWPRQCWMSLRQVFKTLQHEQKNQLAHQRIHSAWYADSCHQLGVKIVHRAANYIVHHSYTVGIHVQQTRFHHVLVWQRGDTGYRRIRCEHHRIQGIVTITTPWLQKISNNIDMTNAQLITLINRFVEEFFNGFFGNVHQMLMTLSFSA